MAMERVTKKQPITKTEFHRRLRTWFEQTNDVKVGGYVDGRTPWVYVRDGADLFVLHADTSRAAVEQYLRLVSELGSDLEWQVAPSDKGNMTAVSYGPAKIRYKPFYFYFA